LILLPAFLSADINPLRVTDPVPMEVRGEEERLSIIA
jgi:hypothetical protein